MLRGKKAHGVFILKLVGLLKTTRSFEVIVYVSPVAHDVVLTLKQRFSDVNNVVIVSKRRRVLTGKWIGW